jgi:hypothetical protein
MAAPITNPSLNLMVTLFPVPAYANPGRSSGPRPLASADRLRLNAASAQHGPPSRDGAVPQCTAQRFIGIGWGYVLTYEIKDGSRSGSGGEADLPKAT